MTSSRTAREVLTKDLAVASVGLAATALFLAGQVAAWAILAFLVSITVRLLASTRGWPLPSKPVKLLILAGGAATVTADFGTVLGLEPGLATVLILIALKILETKDYRDFQVMIMLGYFLAVCDLFFVQDLAHCLAIGGTVILLTIALIRFHQQSTLQRAARLAFTLLAEAVPMIIVLFLFFPRISGGFRVPFSETLRNTTGISDHLDPGAVANLAVDHRLAFRASFPDGDVPAEFDLYWRGIVLWKCDGLTWNRGNALELGRQVRLAGPGTRQSIILEPSSIPWLYALDRPSFDTTPPDTVYSPGSCLKSQRPISKKLYYEVTSYPINHEEFLTEIERKATLQTPANLSPEIRNLAKSWRSEGATDEQVIARAKEFFRAGKFSYSLTPPPYRNPDTALDEFLFQRRIGFCEHYAAAFATLMRASGIPARVVVGYLGGDYNGSYVEVTQADAHAWCEVWKKGEGWERVDPTSVIAPERITEGLESYLESQLAKAGGLNRFSQFTGFRRFLDGAHLLWANLTFQWDMHVLNYDEAQQRTFFAFAGLEKFQGRQIFLGLVVVIPLFLTSLALWLVRPPQAPRDPVALWWNTFCRALAAAGAQRSPAEGPLHFTKRAAAQFPAEAEAILETGRLYAELRYGKSTPPVEHFIRSVRTVGQPRREERASAPAPK